MKNITATGLLFYPLLPKTVKVVNDVVIGKGATMKQYFEKCMNTVKCLTLKTEEVTMVDVALFYLGCWVTFPLPMSSKQFNTSRKTLNSKIFTRGNETFLH